MENTKEENSEVHMACRRGHDKMTEGQSCSSKRCINKTIKGSTTASFECVECHYAWTVPLGGTFNVPT